MIVSLKQMLPLCAVSIATIVHRLDDQRKAQLVSTATNAALHQYNQFHHLAPDLSRPIQSLGHAVSFLPQSLISSSASIYFETMRWRVIQSCLNNTVPNRYVDAHFFLKQALSRMWVRLAFFLSVDYVQSDGVSSQIEPLIFSLYYSLLLPPLGMYGRTMQGGLFSISHKTTALGLHGWGLRQMTCHPLSTMSANVPFIKAELVRAFLFYTWYSAGMNVMSRYFGEPTSLTSAVVHTTYVALSAAILETAMMLRADTRSCLAILLQDQPGRLTSALIKHTCHQSKHWLLLRNIFGNSLVMMCLTFSLRDDVPDMCRQEYADLVDKVSQSSLPDVPFSLSQRSLFSRDSSVEITKKECGLKSGLNRDVASRANDEQSHSWWF